MGSRAASLIAAAGEAPPGYGWGLGGASTPENRVGNRPGARSDYPGQSATATATLVVQPSTASHTKGAHLLLCGERCFFV